MCENKSALERDRSMWEGGHFLISSCDGLVLVAPLPAHLLMRPFCRWNFPTFKISYQTFKHANQRTCKLKKLSNYSVFDLNVPTFSLYRPTHILQRFRSPEFLQAGALICNLLPFLDKICSCDLISLGQEISMLFVFQHLLPARLTSDTLIAEWWWWIYHQGHVLQSSFSVTLILSIYLHGRFACL